MRSPSTLALLGGDALACSRQFPRNRVKASEDCGNAAIRALQSGGWSMFTSDEVSAFETEFAQFVGAKHTVLVNSCTTAILASLMASGIGPGDHVAVPGYTYIGTCMPVLALGAHPVLIDIDPTTQSMDPRSLAQAFEQYSIRAVVQAHLFGLCSGAAEIVELCGRHNAVYIADNAQLLGERGITSTLAEYGATCFSFGESKLLRLGEGGAIATNSDALAERLRLARHEGEQWTRLNSSRLVGTQPTTNDLIEHLSSVQAGLNFRPFSVAAAIGRVMLRELPERLQKLSANAAVFNGLLGGHSCLKLPAEGVRTWWTYPLCVDPKHIERNVALAALLAEGIPVGVHFPRLISEHPTVKERARIGPSGLMGATQFSKTHLVLPIYPSLDTKDIETMCAAVSKVLVNGNDLKSELARARAEHLLKTRPISELCDGLFIFLEDN
ncbi:DegT/DnrJ/EryC1/StrS family aminotransferase [Bordetella genomosp. 5]|uniref:DegT/DnrJ/EryC1/StrS family aminotransferase n=1 Tax=Bordetella genomosp. 5 TaxID=1395608 RepID=UPI0020CEB681|nr:DegT/DnrJ/EryC1/StrS family aminotransferase [Bordetella genomosp. 5]